MAWWCKSSTLPNDNKWDKQALTTKFGWVCQHTAMTITFTPETTCLLMNERTKLSWTFAFNRNSISRAVDFVVPSVSSLEISSKWFCHALYFPQPVKNWLLWTINTYKENLFLYFLIVLPHRSVPCFLFARSFRWTRLRMKFQWVWPSCWMVLCDVSKFRFSFTTCEISIRPFSQWSTHVPQHVYV